MNSGKVFLTHHQFLEEDRVLIDVRSPGEFNHAHIHGALNLPLFTDEERAEVGTLYKQSSPQAALMCGLEIAGRKMRTYVEDAEKIAPGKKIMVHCWRGGKRSESMGWLLSQAGFDVKVLPGGYKRFRSGLFEYLNETKFKIIVIAGKTGTGKTDILKHLSAMNEQVVDLEALANHRGSAFGSLGMDTQPGTEQFENELLQQLAHLDRHKRIFIEDESKMIGRCHIPNEFYQQSKTYARVSIEIPVEERVKRLVDEYGAFPVAHLEERFRIIEARLGNEQMRKAIEHLQAGDLISATKIALMFYDKAYLHQMAAQGFPQELSLCFDHGNIEAIAEEVIRKANDLGL